MTLGAGLQSCLPSRTLLIPYISIEHIASYLFYIGPGLFPFTRSPKFLIFIGLGFPCSPGPISKLTYLHHYDHHCSLTATNSSFDFAFPISQLIICFCSEGHKFPCSYYWRAAIKFRFSSSLAASFL